MSFSVEKAYYLLGADQTEILKFLSPGGPLVFCRTGQDDGMCWLFSVEGHLR